MNLTNQMRDIAASWHAGLNSTLYDFSQTGIVGDEDQLLNEIEAARFDAVEGSDEEIELDLLESFIRMEARNGHAS